MSMDIAKKPCEPQVGADIEGFILNIDSAYPVPCVGLIKGTKEEPHPIAGLPKGFAMQEDNVMVEYNIPPAKNYKSFANNIQAARAAVTDALYALNNSYVLNVSPDMHFKKEHLTSKQAQLIGCDVDYDAYQGGAVRRAPAKPLDNWRSAGGHIHLGGDFQCPDFVAALFCDLSIGLAGNTVGLNSTRRAAWYGQPGVFRPKPYGIEYRTPDANWTASRTTVQRVGAYAINLCKWLTDSDARTIQTTFRAIDWAEVRRLCVFDPNVSTTARKKERATVINAARRAGAPV